MTTTKHTSAVWVTIPAAFEMLEAAGFPQDHQHGKVEVLFGSRTPGPDGESVVLSSYTNQAAGSDWQTAGTPGKEDYPDAVIRVFTNTPGFDENQTWARLAALGQVVEGTFRDLNTGKPIISDALLAAGVRNMVLTLTATSIDPAGAAGANGWLGAAEFALRITARI